MTHQVDPWRFAGTFLKNVLSSRIPDEPAYADIPWTPPREPGHVEHLPFVWHEPPKETRWHPSEPSPIIALMQRRRRESAD